tara:strand:- start:72 stop:176 length:105 start_codon:yes stop_codon:yes gene_type:complete
MCFFYKKLLDELCIMKLAIMKKVSYRFFSLINYA